MMKLILFVFCAIFSVQSKITTTKTLIKAGDPFTLECDKPTAKWKLKQTIIAQCLNCPSPTCYVHQAYRKRIIVFCERNKSLLYFHSTQIGDKGSVKCSESDSAAFRLLVGSYNAHLRSENNSPFALIQKDYTLVCDKEHDGDILWYNGQAERLRYFSKDCSDEYSNYDAKRFDITCDEKQKKAKFHIKHVTLSEDGKIIGCESAQRLYLFSLTVNVPVTSVSIQSQSQALLENEDGIFVCRVEESKPEASFQWIIAYKDGSAQEIQQKSTISKILKGKLWQTTSTLKLNMKRDYQKIMCKATIENMPWTNSEYQSLDIKYYPIIKMNDTITVIENETNKLSCPTEGNPKPTIKWKIGHNIVKSKLLQVSFTRNNETAVQCIATANSTKHGILESSKNISIFVTYPPQGKPSISVSQSGICAGKDIEILCEWAGGNPEATVRLSCFPEVKEGSSSVSIRKLVTQKMDRTCTCNGKHIGKNAVTEKELNIHYPPNKVTINQTSYFEGQTASLICDASGGNPAVYTYSWSPGNYPHAKTINIHLTKAFNKKAFTCKVYHECSEGKPVSSTKKLNVEYYPIIKMNDTITVIENETNKLSCPTEGNPKPTIKWKIGHNIVKSKLLQVSFTRNNETAVQCIATANSTKHGILESSKNISIFVTYPPQGKPSISVSQSGICAGKDIEILCEWAGGNPEATVRLSCFPEVKEGSSSVSIRKLVTQKMDRTCTCNGKHIGKNAVTEKELNIHYPPNKVTINQTSYFEGQTASLICDASGGNPAVYTYSWSPGNYPHAKTINIHLTKAFNKKAFTCKVYHECSEGKPVSSTKKLNVEYYPIIKMNDTITVIENETNKLSCPTEGNPKPTIKWKIGHNIVKSKLLQVSFTRNNETAVQCIATANSTKHGILESSKNISIFVTYPPQGKPSISVSQSGICAGKDIEILCEWAGGNPEATVRLSCFPEVKEGSSSVSIRKLVTQKMDRTCTCNGKHIGKNAVTEKELNIHYPPNKVTINQTSYFEGQTASLICDASGGNPAVYTYSWSPGNYPHAKTINIHLTKAFNKKAFTCKVYHECSEGKPVSSTKKLNVEYYPIIKMNDTITVIENETNKLSCPTEGNPKPTIKWKIGHNIVKSKLLQVSFTRNNETAVQCIATANSTKHGILESSKNISIFVTYSPEITIHHNVTRLQQKAQIRCTAQASPNKIQYTMVQKWANTEKKKISAKQQNFRSFSFQDLGNWICLASNDVPKKGYYSKKSVEIKVNVSAQFKGDENETAMVGSKKRLKTCFYCYPEATEVKWYKGNEEMSSDRIYYVPAKDGLFPFTGNCSILELDITEKNIQIYYLYVTNPVGKRTFELTLDSGIPADSPIYIIVSCVIAVFVIIIIIGGIVYVKFRRSSKKKQSNNNPTNNVRSSEGHALTAESECDHIYDVCRSSGQPTGNEIAMSQRHALTAESECDHIYDVCRSSGPELTAESEYAYIYDVCRSSGQPTGNEIAMSQHHTYENEPFYIDVTNAPIRTGHALTAESEYTIMYNVPRSSGQPTGNEIPYDDIAMSQNRTYENEPFYIDVINTPIRTGHLDYEDLNN